MDNILIGSEGNILIGYEIFLPEKYSLSEEGFDIINESFCRGLRDLPKNTIFIKHDLFNPVNVDTQYFPKHNFIQQEYSEYFSKKTFLSHTTYIFFVLPNKIIRNERLKNPLRPPFKKEFLEFDKKIEEFSKEVSRCVDSLKNIRVLNEKSFQIIPIKQKTLNNYYDFYMSGMNPDFTVEIKKNWEYLNIGSEFASVVRFSDETTFPETVNTCKYDEEKSKNDAKFFKNYGDDFGHQLNFKHIYVQIAIIDDNKLHIENAKKNNVLLHKATTFDKQNKIWAEDTDKEFEVLSKNADRERIVRCHNNIIVFAESPEELTKKLDLVSQTFKKIDFSATRLYGDNLLAVYEYSYPLNSHHFLESHLYISSLNVFFALSILTGKYNSDQEGILFNSRIDNTPVTVDLWDERKKYAKSRNFIFLAPTGYGKSFTINHIITNFVSGTNSKVVMIDLGGSYRKLSAIFKDRSINISHSIGQRLGLNPFDLRGEKPNAEKLNELSEYIGIHYKVKEPLNSNQKVAIEKIVDYYYSKNPLSPSLPNFIQWFYESKKEVYEKLELSDKFLDSSEFFLQMTQFTTGTYSYLYSGEGEDIGAELFEKDIIIFELDQIRENQLLLSIMLHQIYHTINRVIWRDTSTRGMVIFEEFAEQLKWDGMISRIEWFAQAIRKQNSSLGLVLQTITQLPNNDSSKNIISNSEFLYVIKASNYDDIVERFNLPKHALYQMHSISSDFEGERKYSEVFIRRGRERQTNQVYRLEVPRTVFWAYQTDGAMNSLLMQVFDLTHDMELSVKIMTTYEASFVEINKKREKNLLSKEEIEIEINNIINLYQNEN